MSLTPATIVADFNTSLQAGVSVGDTIGVLQSVIDADGIAVVPGRYFFTIDGGNTIKEHISCNLDASGNMTAIKSISRQGAESTGFVRAHRLGATVTITDFAHILAILQQGGGGIGSPQASSKAYLGITQSIPSGVHTLVNLDTLSFDTGANFNTVSHRFVATVAGYYSVDAGVYFIDGQNGSFYEVTVSKNGVVFASGANNGNGSQDTQPTTASAVYLDIGDYVELKAYHNSSSSKSVVANQSGTFLSLTLVSTSSQSASIANAYLNGAQSIPTGVITKVLLDTELFDINNNFDTTTHRFTATIAGYYQVNAELQYISPVQSGKAFFILVYKNGADIIENETQSGSSADGIGIAVSSVVYLAVGDYLELYTVHNCSGGQSLHAGFTPINFLSVFLITNSNSLSQGNLIAQDTTQVVVTGDTAEHTLYSVSIPGGTLGTNKAIRFKIVGSGSLGNTKTAVFKIKYGATTLVTLSQTSIIDGDFTIEGLIMANASASAQKGTARLIANNTTSVNSIQAHGTASEVSSGALNLVITVQPDFASTNITAEAIVVEKIV